MARFCPKNIQWLVLQSTGNTRGGTNLGAVEMGLAQFNTEFEKSVQ